MKNRLFFTLLLWLVLPLTNCYAQSNITYIEYYIDNDPGYGLATSISFTPSTNLANLNIPINPNNLPAGIHTIHVRAKNANGSWSLQSLQTFYKPHIPASSTSTPNITKLEYYIDNDPGYGLATNVTITPTANISNLIIPINPTTISIGLHTIHVRAKDANGSWSLQNQNVFYKPYTVPAVPAIANITKVEYYIDADPSYDAATNVPITSTTQINNLIIPINTTTLNVGIHSLHVRAKDAMGNWSLQHQKVFYKPYGVPAQPTLTNIVKVEYYMDYDPGYGNATNIPITPGSNLSNLLLPIDPFPMTICEHQLFIRAQDANGHWSLVNNAPIIISMTVSVKLFFEGYYNGNSSMRQVLSNQGVATGPCDEVDSVDVELRNTTPPHSVAHSYRGIIRSDGVLPCKFPNTINGNMYYIAIKHRNGLATWSASPVLMSQTTSYDFSDAANKAYGNNQVEVENGVWALYSGDLNSDENIDLLDLAEEEDGINNFYFGYYNTDINGDGNVDLLDIPIAEVNTNLFISSMHP